MMLLIPGGLIPGLIVIFLGLFVPPFNDPGTQVLTLLIGLL
ncbi:MAG TPA: hypothetical protein VEG44_07085 [Candidatus Acidoferrales bacterium]|nr:hypothetical protein [Candidatus Acidoferrales bacterium]